MATGSSTAPKEKREVIQFMPQHYAMATLVKMNQLRKNNILCDVILMVGQHQVPAHRVVLAGCSQYFCAMFTVNMSESRQEVIEIKGVEPDVLELLIEFAYTSQLDGWIIFLITALASAKLKTRISEGYSVTPFHPIDLKFGMYTRLGVFYLSLKFQVSISSGSEVTEGSHLS
eukprot:sb/3472075/